MADPTLSTTKQSFEVRPGDAPPRGWVDRAPGRARPYLRLARLDRPIGIWLLLLPCWWSVALAAPAGTWPQWDLLLLFLIGAAAMRGAGCVFNDIVDRDLDAGVARTRGRPLPSGAVGVGAAIAFMAALALTGLAVLLSFNGFAVVLGLLSLVPVAVYPFLKRITYWPQAGLGVAFNWGGMLGWAAVRGTLDWPAAALFAAGFFWTLGYDTIYAHQDKEDDAIVGVKSTALRLGSRTRPFLALVYALTVALVAWAGWTAGSGAGFWVGLGLFALHLGRQTVAADFDDPADCLARFKSNAAAGLILFLGLVIGQRFA